MSGISEDVGKLRSIIGSMKNGIELGDPIETLEWCADEIDRLRAENKELRASYERVDRALTEAKHNWAVKLAPDLVSAMEKEYGA